VQQDAQDVVDHGESLGDTGLVLEEVAYLLRLGETHVAVVVLLGLSAQVDQVLDAGLLEVVLLVELVLEEFVDVVLSLGFVDAVVESVVLLAAAVVGGAELVPLAA